MLCLTEGDTAGQAGQFTGAGDLDRCRYAGRNERVSGDGAGNGRHERQRQEQTRVPLRRGHELTVDVTVR